MSYKIITKLRIEQLSRLFSFNIKNDNKMAEPLKIESNDGFLHLEDLPHNCIFNKVVTGCGGTTVVLQNAEDYVIAVPTTELIINKTGRTNAGSSVLTFDGKE